MNDIEAFLLFLSYILPFGGIANIFVGITENDKVRIIFGLACMVITLLIMGYLLYHAEKDNHKLAKNSNKPQLLFGMFRHIVIGCSLMVVEFLVMWNFNIQIRYIIAIICISLVIMTIIITIFEKI